MINAIADLACSSQELLIGTLDRLDCIQDSIRSAKRFPVMFASRAAGLWRGQSDRCRHLNQLLVPVLAVLALAA